MDGLIDQAKTQLWTIVNQFATAHRQGKIPVLQVALYEYGKSSIPADENYLRMIVPLTTDLDKVSQELFAPDHQRRRLDASARTGHRSGPELRGAGLHG